MWGLTFYSHMKSTYMTSLFWVHRFSLTPLPYFEVPVSSQENERPCICVLEISILLLSTILIFDFGIVPTVWYFWFFIIILFKICKFLKKASFNFMLVYMEAMTTCLLIPLGVKNTNKSISDIWYDRMVVGFTITCASTRNVNSNPVYGEVYWIQHYVIKFVSDTNKNDRHNITEILLKVALSTINQQIFNIVKS